MDVALGGVGGEEGGVARLFGGGHGVGIRGGEGCCCRELECGLRS